MCMISVITDYGRNIPLQQWTPNTWNDFSEVLRRLKALDEKLDQPHCEDPAKAAWMREVEARLAELERSAWPVR